VELPHLRYFVAVAEEGSLTVAAERFWSPNYIQHGAHPMKLAQTDSLSRDQSSWNCRTFPNHNATPLGVLIICAARHTTAGRSAERCTSSRKLGHAAG
jgi:hypothetical protein